MGDAVNVDAACCDIGRYQHPAVARAEGGERLLSLALRFVAMNSRSGDAGRSQVPGDAVVAALRPGEHQCTGNRAVFEQRRQQ